MLIKLKLTFGDKFIAMIQDERKVHKLACKSIIFNEFNTKEHSIIF